MKPQSMKTRTISFRCPEELLEEIDLLSKHNRVDRSDFIVHSLQSLLAGLAQQGVCKPLPPLAGAPQKTDP